MEKPSKLLILAAVAACSGAPVIQQSVPTAPKTDPKTEAEVSTALETAKLIKDKCMDMLSDGETSFKTEEYGGKVTTELRIEKGSQNGDTITEETCECIYRTDIPTFVREKASCEYSYDIRTIESEHLKTEHSGISDITHTEKPDGISFTSLRTGTHETDRNPFTVGSRFVTETSANRSGCRTFSGDAGPTLTDWKKMSKMPYDPAKLDSCEHFANEVSILADEVRDAICEELERQGVSYDSIPPLCSKGKVYAPAEPGKK